MSGTPKPEEIASLASGDGIEVRTARWTFAGDVARKFDDHVGKSVPLYDSGHDLTAKLSDFFVKPDSTVYELGTSTGRLLRRLADRHGDLPNARFIGLEAEPDMVTHAKKVHADVANMFFHVCRAETFEFEKSDFITSHYTIQFIPPKHRQALFDRIYDALEWGAPSCCSRRCGRTTPASRTSSRRSTTSSRPTTATTTGRSSPRP